MAFCILCVLVSFLQVMRADDKIEDVTERLTTFVNAVCKYFSDCTRAFPPSSKILQDCLTMIAAQRLELVCNNVLGTFSLCVCVCVCVCVCLSVYVTSLSIPNSAPHDCLKTCPLFHRRIR